jgi:two-component system, NtrC family, nitrogen regulation sensor histidine kinase NtrY
MRVFQAPYMKTIKNILFKYPFLPIAVIVFAGTLILEKYGDVLDSKTINAEHVQTVLAKKESTTIMNLQKMAEVIKKEGLDSFKSIHAPDYYDLYEDKGIVILGYQGGNLKFWNSNLVPIQINETIQKDSGRVINAGNGWYVVNRHTINDSLTLIGFILIKHDYVFENEFLINDFHPDFDLFPEAELVFTPEGENIILNGKGEFLFSLIEPDPPVYSNTFSVLTCVLYSVSLILFLIFLYHSFNIFNINTVTARNIWLAGVILLLLTLRHVMLSAGFPEIFRSLSLFQPQHYAKSPAFPSLGDFLINSVLILFVSICFSSYFRLMDRDANPRNFKNIGWIIMLSIILVIFMFYFHYLFSGLIFNSNIQLEVYNFFYLNQFSFIAYFILAILLASLVIFTDKVVFLASTLVGLKSFILIFAGSLFAGTLVYILIEESVSIYAVSFFTVMTGSIIWIRYFRYRYTYSFQLYLIFIISVFTLAFITNKSREKEKNIRQVLVVNLANERDQIAEFLLGEIENNLGNDEIIKTSLSSPDHDDYDLIGYLENNYFGGYFRKYELQIASCGNDADLLLEDVNEWVDCYSFFHDMIDNSGVPVSANSGFYFLDNLTGRISYLGSVVYEFDEYPYEKTLFISLDSKLMVDHLGYPELLLEGKFSANSLMVQYSHAKYNNEQLITRSGNFPYALSLRFDPEPGVEFSFAVKDGYEHLVYQIDDSNVIVMSRPVTGIIDILTSFSYNFVFFYLLYLLALLILNRPFNLRKWQIDFKNKIKFSMIGVLLLSLLIIGVGTIFYNIRQFENKQYESISEKIQSVIVELEYRLGLERELTPEMNYYITGLLIQISNVFNTDINLYDLEGNLYTSSRPEVFNLGLIGEQMNPQAYSGMLLEKSARFIHKESISNLSYLSAYVPFTNTHNEVLAYINLPYFTRQSVLRKEIYTLVVAVANIYAILILITILIAVIVSNTITKPLQLIQDRLGELSIGKTNEQIDYESDDEIGSLIKEFNRMVVELEKSAVLLARSERESAWREMAKQIAHEIKNPLTPMKLSIQHMQRAWEDRIDNWEELFKTTSRNLVEQIDHLSSIATAFSNFAKLPKTTRGKVDIINQISNAAGLFSNTDNIDISLNLNNIDELYVISDKVHLNRVFINLLKNAIQAIPKSRKGKITIELSREKDMAVVTIRDNGTGVPPEARDKMFIPNFTTKSGGMGLGLAIVKNIIEQSGGYVGFNSEHHKGSSFFFSLPIADSGNHKS